MTGQSDLTTPGARIRAAREAIGLTLAALSGRTGYCVPQLSLMERGLRNIPLRSFTVIAAALGVTPAYLAFGAAPHGPDLTAVNLGLRRVLSGVEARLKDLLAVVAGVITTEGGAA